MNNEYCPRLSLGLAGRRRSVLHHPHSFIKRVFRAATPVVLTSLIGQVRAQQIVPVVTPPVVRTKADAIYPPLPEVRREPADVVLFVTIDAEGARTVLFHAAVDKDLVFSQAAGRNVIGGPTNRVGSANSVRVTGPFYDVATNLTWARATFDDTHLLIPYVPDFVFRLDSAVHRELPWLQDHLQNRPLRVTFALGSTYVGPRPLPYAVRSDAIITLDAHASAGWRFVTLGVSAQNLLTAVQNGQSFPFTASVTIGANRQQQVTNPAMPGANPICHQRIVTPIAVELTPAAGGTLELRIDPRPMFNTVDFTTLTQVSDSPLLYRIPDENRGAGAALFKGLLANAGVYTFQWVNDPQ